MKMAKYVSMSKQQREEKITNRILINLGLGVAAFMILRVFSNMNTDMKTVSTMPTFMLYVAAALFVGAIACYVFSKKKPALRNYGHVLVVAFLVAIYLNMPKYLGMFMTMGQHAEFNEIPFVAKFIKNTQTSYKYVNWALGIYLAAMLIYNIVILIIANKKAANAKAAVKAESSKSKYKR